MRWLGGVGYRWALKLLPRWLSEESGADMARAFDERQRWAVDRGGAIALVVLWARELMGIVSVAYRSRRPDGWTRKTAPFEPQHHTPPSPSSLHVMANTLHDLRFALRMLARRPAVILLSTLTLALGIGSSTAMFSVIDSVLLRSLDYPEPDRLHRVHPGWPDLVGHATLGDLATRGTWSWPEFWLVSEQQEVFEYLAAYYQATVTLNHDDARPERVTVGVTSRELFPMLAAGTAIGRVFSEDDGRGQDELILLGYETWQDRYGGSPDIVGTNIRINDRPRTVVGVLADGFEVAGTPAPMWLLRTGSSTDEGLGNHGGAVALGRLLDGVTPERAQAEVERILQSLPASHGVHSGHVYPLQPELTRTVRPVLILMLAAAGLLLLVACGNVAAILLGSGIDRERELAVRGAIGATRGRLVKQLLTESVVLAVLGSVGGILVASVTTKALTFLAPPGVPNLDEVAVDGGVLLFAVGLSILAGIAFGLVPALSLSTTKLASAMASARVAGNPRARLQAAVVIGELALATVLLVGGLLLTRTVSALNGVDPGFDAEGLVVVSTALPFQRFQSEDEDESRRSLEAYVGQISEALEALPGVVGVNSVSSPPFFNWRGNNDVLPEGWHDPEHPPIAERRFVTERYLSFMGIPLVEGRDFERSDYDEGAEPVVVLSQGLAELAWPGESAVGKRVVYWSTDARVIGVAENIRDEELTRVTEMAYYAPMADGRGMGSPFLLRVSGNAADLIPSIRERIWSVDPDLPISRALPMAELVSDQMSQQVYRARLMAVFAALAGVFATLGIYGVTARSAARRVKEMGLRVALGAPMGRIRGTFTLQAVRLALAGIAAGMTASFALGGILDRFLWGVSRTDPVTLVAVAMGLLGLAVLAALPSAQRATRADPLEALRGD